MKPRLRQIQQDGATANQAPLWDTALGRWVAKTITAALVTNTPAGSIAATTVQDALNELDTEKASAGHTHSTPTASQIAYSGSTNLSATDVEAALDELDAEKSATTHTHAATGNANSYGAGVPTFSGRTPGDIHHNETDGKIYMLKGSAGGIYVDNANRANNSTPGTFSDGSKTWTEVGGGNWEVNSNQLWNNGVAGPGSIYVMLAAQAQVISCDVVNTSQNGGPFIRGSGAGYSTGQGGYFLQFSGTSVGNTIRLYRAGVQIDSTTLSAKGIAGPIATCEISATTTGGVTRVTAKVNGVVIFTYDDASPVTGTQVGLAGGSASTTARFDNVSITDGGTLAWTAIT